ncbi:matrixin family metalloprotease [Lacimicrobium alkaliphilum]|uniref:Peptidase metallopeptidase domain-containing protein n=1 Tax=Lacimicrobium alkaliphilum TaxID=1526571 RepID=A0ABQ1R4J7_9ALTE|nr:matrixin family metalloprotease [Lacimicrobium alkaliphilum]GGD54430.1 hypothetical protein GCM10011357_07680 [Lacimicrobium alkaliphilum]
MRSVTRTTLPIPVLILAGLMLPEPAHAGEGGYRLLELEGYKVKWGDRRLGTGASISYAFAGSRLRFDEARNCGELAPIETLVGEKLSRKTLSRETAAAFQVWERAAGLSFHEVSDPHDADIVLGAQGKPRGSAFANVSYASEEKDGVRAIEQSLVCLNPEHKWKVGFDGDEDVYDIRYTLIHEIGHAIGLDHPGPSGQVMAFRYTEAYNDLQSGDLRGVQLLYGHAADDDKLAAIAVTQAEQEPTEVYQVNNLNRQSITDTAESALPVINGSAEAKP